MYNDYDDLLDDPVTLFQAQISLTTRFLPGGQYD